MQPKVAAGDMDLIKGSIDFLVINHYSSSQVAFNEGGGYLKLSNTDLIYGDMGRTESGWGIYPPGIKNLMMDFKDNFNNPPVIICENGCSMPDVISPDGKVHDERRIAYLNDYLANIHEAIQAGCNMKGYLVGSLMDNFEWAQGYSKRFGIVHVDYSTQKRTPKDSAYWYGAVIRRNVLE